MNVILIDRKEYFFHNVAALRFPFFFILSFIFYFLFFIFYFLFFIFYFFFLLFCLFIFSKNTIQRSSCGGLGK